MADPQPKPGKGCLFYLGIIAAISLLMLALGAFFGLRYAKGLVNQLTEAQPAQLPTVQLPEAQMFQLHDRVATFRDGVRDGDAVEPLELTADELNALIETDPAMAPLKNHLFVTIDGNQLGAQISFRAEDLGLVRLQGRYVNATGVFHVAINTNELQITAESLAVRGKPVPRNIMREVTAENLADKFNQDPRTSAGLKKLQSIEVKDGKLIIVPKK
jgi:hypothetical protein